MCSPNGSSQRQRRSRRRSSNGRGAKGNDSIFQRLHSKAEELEERRKQREAQALEEEGRLFQPTVSEANDILLTARSARLNESHLERTERLAYVDMKRREAIRQQLEQAHYSQYTHQPKIDTISARLARSKTDAELSANPQGKALKESLAKKKEKLEAESCPFKPQLDRRSQQLAEKTGSRSVFGPESVDHLTERLELEARERQERLERQRRGWKPRSCATARSSRRSRVPAEVPTRRPMRSRS